MSKYIESISPVVVMPRLPLGKLPPQAADEGLLWRAAVHVINEDIGSRYG